MKKIGFYLLGKKGYQSLISFVDCYGNDYVAFVVVAQDKGVKNDYFNEICKLCADWNISFYSRLQTTKEDSDIDFAIGWRWLISDSKKLIVFHDSLLPKYRGFAPLVNMLINGEEEIGVTALFASECYDSGDIIDQKSVIIQYPIKISDAIDTVAGLYAAVLIKIANCLISGIEITATRQDEAKATFSLWRDDLDYEINWEQDSETICRFVDAVGYPYAGAKTKCNGRWVGILGADLIQDVVVEERSPHIGKIIFMNSGEPTIVCAKGLIKLTHVVDEDGNCLIGKIPFRTRFGV